MTNDMSQWSSRLVAAVDVLPIQRFPIVIEVAGMPRTGKSTFVDSLLELLMHSGFCASLVSFANKSAPIRDRWSFDFSAWTTFSYLRAFHEHKSCGTQFLIADRGIFDSLAFMKLKLKAGEGNPKAAITLERLALCSPWIDHLCQVLIFYGDIELIERRHAERRLYPGEALVTRREVLEPLQEVLFEEMERWNREAPIVKPFRFDHGPIGQMLSQATEEVIHAVEVLSRR